MAKRATRKKTAKWLDTPHTRYLRSGVSHLAIERASRQVSNGEIRHAFSMSGLTLGTVHFKPVSKSRRLVSQLSKSTGRG